MSFMLLGILNSQASGGAAGAFDLLQTTTLGGNASTIQFNGLSSFSDYKHLQLRTVTRTNRGGTDASVKLRVNGDTNDSNYSGHELYAGFGEVNSYNNNAAFIAKTTGSVYAHYGVSVTDILDFQNTSKFTTFRTFGGANGYQYMSINGMAFLNTNALTSLTITVGEGNSYIAGSRFSLYGTRG
tara:strand:- start:245 stop:796 length:552 start_codon:yes stop_codon:yes gene_type:complete